MDADWKQAIFIFRLKQTWPRAWDETRLRSANHSSRKYPNTGTGGTQYLGISPCQPDQVDMNRVAQFQVLVVTIQCGKGMVIIEIEVT